MVSAVSTSIEKLFGAGAGRLSYRRLLVFAIVIGLATWLTVTTALTGEQWVDVVKWVAGIFLGAEGAEKVAGLLGAARVDTAKAEAE